MKSKRGVESKIPKAKTNTNRKRADIVEEKKISIAALKKNEFALIILGALLLTLVIFFVFTRTSGKKHDTVKQGIASSPAGFSGFEKRIEAVEKKLAEISGTDSSEVKNNAVRDIDERLTRLETAVSLKFDTLSGKLARLETAISRLKKQAGSVHVASKQAVPVKKIVKKTAEKHDKASMFHTVRKGETLYSISKKYHTSVKALRKLNHLSVNDKIYPGTNILVR